MDIIIILGGALIIDVVFREPPLPLHPVVWMGKFTSLWEKWGLRQKSSFQLIFGIILTLATITLFTLPIYFLMDFLSNWNFLAYLIIGILLLKTTFSLRELGQAAKKIKLLLLEDNLPLARFNLRALVKRESQDLTIPLVVSATVESVAENTCDSFVGPLFYLLIFGIPGAVAYRVINTLDAMIGIHGKYEYLGKFAARLDDIVNFIPARLTAVLIVLAAHFMRANARAAWKIMARDHSRTASPNAGWPISAAAGALNVKLIKINHYRVGDNRQPLVPDTIDSSIELMFCSSFCWIFICFIVEVTRFAINLQA